MQSRVGMQSGFHHSRKRIVVEVLGVVAVLGLLVWGVLALAGTLAAAALPLVPPSVDTQLGETSGINATEVIRKADPKARILVFSSFARDEDIHRAIIAGALGYLQKAAPREDLLEAVRTVASAQRYLPPVIAARLADRIGRPEPSPREREILTLIASGLSNKEIAPALGVSEETVKHHVSNLLAKLDVRDRTQAVTEALGRGLIDIRTR